MLVRIGDEKREMLDAHLGVLKTKLLKTDEHQVDTKENTVEVLGKVIRNMPHKLKIYAGLFLLLSEDMAFAQSLLEALMPTLFDCFATADAFECRNVCSWLGHMNKYGLLSPEAAEQFKSSLRTA